MRAGRNAGRSATTRMGVGLHERPSRAHGRSRGRGRTLAHRVEAITERFGDGPLRIAAQHYLTAEIPGTKEVR
jgi:hypothetical protein